MADERCTTLTSQPSLVTINIVCCGWGASHFVSEYCPQCYMNGYVNCYKNS